MGWGDSVASQFIADARFSGGRMATSSIECMFQALRQLSDNELYDDAACLGSILMSHCESGDDGLSLADRVHAHQLYAHALFEIGELKKAEEFYYGALRALKEKSTGRSSSSNRRHSTNAKCDSVEIEVRYALSRCLERQGKLVEAVGVLDAVPARRRPPKALAALARLYARADGRTQRQRHAGENAAVAAGRPSQVAVECYGALLKQMPLCLHSLRHYLGLGGTQAAASELVNEGLRSVADDCAVPPWLDDWLCAHAALARHSNAKAVGVLRRLSTTAPLMNNDRVLESLAAAYRQCGEPAKALLVLQRWRAADPHSLRPVAPLAAALAQEKRVKELEQLADWARRTAPDRTETWMALAHLSRAHGRPAEALFFAAKATLSDDDSPRSDAMLLKARVLMDSKRYPQAVQHIREALSAGGGGGRADMECFEALVDCYLAQGRPNEANAAAKMALDALGHRAPRALVLAAKVLSRDGRTLPRAKQMLETAIKTAPHLLPAVYLLIDLYDKSREYDKAIALLREMITVHVNSNLHQMLGDFLSKANRAVEAVDCYKHAAILDPASAHKHSASLGASLSKAGDDCHNVVAAHVAHSDADASSSLDEGASTAALASAGDDAGGTASASGDAMPQTAGDLFTPPDALVAGSAAAGPPRRPRRTRFEMPPGASVDLFSPGALAASTQDSDTEMDAMPSGSGTGSGESVRNRLFDRSDGHNDDDDSAGFSAFGLA